MNKIILLLILLLLQGCSNIELTNVSYEDVNFDSSTIKNKTPVNVEIDTHCLLLFCNRYDYGKVGPVLKDPLIYDTIKKNQDKGNAITDIDIKEEVYFFLVYIYRKITLTGNMFEDKE